MKNCVRYRGGRADDPYLANPARAEIGHVRIRFVDKIDVEYERRVRVDGSLEKEPPEWVTAYEFKGE